MDQTTEAIFSTAIFLTLLTMTTVVTLGIFSSLAAREADRTRYHVASGISGFIALTNGRSASSWHEWEPSTDPLAYGLPTTTRIEINATLFTFRDGEPSPLWSKCAGEVQLGGGEFERLILLDDESALLLAVEVA